MQFKSFYNSPLGKILLAGDEFALHGLWFVGQKNFNTISKNSLEKLHENLMQNSHQEPILLFNKVKKWLDIYFDAKEPDFNIPLKLNGTPFQNEVWKILQSIPYGQITTYGQIATILAKQRNLSKMSAQAVGNAIGKNPISILIPCHRVLGANGDLIGYAGGIDRKIKLLNLEKVNLKNLS